MAQMARPIHQANFLLYLEISLKVSEFQIVVSLTFPLPIFRCEAFSTYPRTYDLLHLDGLFTAESHRSS